MFWTQVHQRPLPSLGYGCHRSAERIARRRLADIKNVSEHVTSMNANKHWIINFNRFAMDIKLAHIAHAQCDMRLGVDLTLERNEVEFAPGSFDWRSTHRIDARYKCLLSKSIFNNLFNAAHTNVMFGAQWLKIIHPSHFTVRSHDLDDDSSGL
jgi:hypothetical protein